MKKTYIIPEAMTVRLAATQAILATSGAITFGDDGTGSGKLIDEDADSDGLVKGSSGLWGREW